SENQIVCADAINLTPPTVDRVVEILEINPTSAVRCQLQRI
ncbi:MAG: hypothetical protein QOH91_1618, partial [Mycobacterium sp.]|nr:hypothetical protein [Mycobacterium sp.]